MRTTGRYLIEDFAAEYAKRARAKAALVSTSWHSNVLNVSESLIEKHAAELNVRRRQLSATSSNASDDSRWLQAVESFIDQVIDRSGLYVRSSPGRLRAVRWMIASATAQYASSTAQTSFDDENAVEQDAA